MNILAIVILFISIYGTYRLISKLYPPIDNNFGYKYLEYKKTNQDIKFFIIIASILMGLLIWALVMNIIISFFEIKL